MAFWFQSFEECGPAARSLLFSPLAFPPHPKRSVSVSTEKAVRTRLSQWDWSSVELGQTLKYQTTVQHMKVVLIAITAGIFQTNQMTFEKEFGDGVSDDLVMLFSRSTCIDVVVEKMDFSCYVWHVPLGSLAQVRVS